MAIGTPTCPTVPSLMYFLHPQCRSFLVWILFVVVEIGRAIASLLIGFGECERGFPLLTLFAIQYTKLDPFRRLISHRREIIARLIAFFSSFSPSLFFSLGLSVSYSFSLLLLFIQSFFLSLFSFFLFFLSFSFFFLSPFLSLLLTSYLHFFLFTSLSLFLSFSL